MNATRDLLLTDGSSARERLVEYTQPHSFAYEVTAFPHALRLLVEGVRGEWTFTPDGSGTLIRWTYEIKPRPHRGGILGRVVGPLWRRYMQDGLTLTIDEAERAAGGQ